MVGVLIDYGDKDQKEDWLKIVDTFEVALNEKGWRLEELKKEVPKE